MKTLNIQAKAIAGFAFTGLLLGLTQTSAMGVTIDLFSDVSDPDGEGNNPGLFQTVIDNSANSASVSDIDSSLTGVIGGQRTLVVNVLEKTGGGSSANAVLEVDTDVGQISLSSANAIRPRATIKWDGDYGINGIDLTEGSTDDSLRLNIDSNDLGVTLNFTVRDINNNISTSSQSFAQGVTGDQYFRYTNFTGSADFTKASFIQLETSNEPLSLDFSFNFVQTDREVPFEFSPSLGLILGGGFFGFLKLRNKFKESKIV